MGINRLKTYLMANINFVIPIGLMIVIIFSGGISVYVVERNKPGANITNLGNALWWAVITVTTVGYGDYTPITPLGRVIAVVLMFSGIGIVVTIVTLLSQRRLEHTESMLKIKLKTEVQPKLLGDETKTAIKDEIDGIEKMTEEDFDRLLVMIKGLRRTVPRDPRPHTGVQDVVLFTTLSLNFAATVVLSCQIPQSLFRTPNFL